MRHLKIRVDQMSTRMLEDLLSSSYYVQSVGACQKEPIASPMRFYSITQWAYGSVLGWNDFKYQNKTRQATTKVFKEGFGILFYNFHYRTSDRALILK